MKRRNFITASAIITGLAATGKGEEAVNVIAEYGKPTQLADPKYLVPFTCENGQTTYALIEGTYKSDFTVIQLPNGEEVKLFHGDSIYYFDGKFIITRSQWDGIRKDLE